LPWHLRDGQASERHKRVTLCLCPSLPYFVLSCESIPPSISIASSKNTFLYTVTLTCILLDGGREPGKKYDSYQLWHANVVGSADEGVDIDNVRADEFSTSITY